MSQESGIPSRPNRSQLRGTLITASFLLGIAVGLPALAAESPRDAAARIAASRWNVSGAEVEVVGEAQVDGVSRFKIFDRTTGRVAGVDLAADNREVPPRVVEEKLVARRNADFIGKKEKDLVRKIEDSPANGTVGVVVWAKTPGPPPRLARDKSSPSAVEIQSFKTFHRSATQGLQELARQSGWRVKYQAEYAPLIVIEVPRAALPVLEAREEVDAIYLERTYQNELDVSVPAIDAGTVWTRGFNGLGITVAVIESGGIYYGHDNLADGRYCHPGSPNIGFHPSGVAGVIASTHGIYRGVAFGAPAILSGNAGDLLQDANAIVCTEWAMDQGARLINYSFGVDSTSALVGLDRYVDYIVRHVYVTIVKSAGNIGSTCSAPDNNVTSPGKGWNIITVGGYDDKKTVNNADDVMSNTSCYGNPASGHGDREKPEVSAPGMDIKTTSCTGPSDCTGSESGTSFAAPHVVGCATLMMDRDVSLGNWPESIKAVLMASAVVNLEGSTRLSDRDGAGGIECDSADDVIRGASGEEWHGTLVKTGFPKHHPFFVKAGQTVRVALAWNSLTGAISGSPSPTTDFLNADLDLFVISPSGALIASSNSFDNANEIVEFKASETGAYIARIFAYRFDGTEEYLALAWWAGTREKD